MRVLFVFVGLEFWRIWKARPTFIFLSLVAAGPFLFTYFSAAITASDIDSTRSILLGAIMVLLATRGFPLDFENGTFRTLLLQGIKREYIVVAKILAMILAAILVYLPWEISKSLALQGTPQVWLAFGYDIGLDICISLGYASLFTAAIFLGKESYGAMLSVLFYISDLAIFFLTQTTPPILARNSAGGSVAHLLSRVSVSVQGLQFSYPSLYGKFPLEMLYFLIFSSVLILLSILLFKKLDLSH